MPLFEGLLSPGPGQSRPLKFPSQSVANAAAAATWQGTTRYVQDLMASPAATDNPLLASSTARMLAAVTLATFPNTAVTDPTIEDRRDAHPATLRRAIAFIEENAHRDITAADIAAACFTTLRAVQLAFQRHLGTTPMAYLRRVRLEHAHRDLLAADPARETITTVAYRWGFNGSSRFAAAYRRAYGISPSQALRKN